MKSRKKALIIGIYNPDLIDFWPWHYHYEHGEYLSEKYRKCGEEKAAKFKKKEEAENEIKIWFTEAEIMDYDMAIDKILYSMEWEASK